MDGMDEECVGPGIHSLVESELHTRRAHDYLYTSVGYLTYPSVQVEYIQSKVGITYARRMCTVALVPAAVRFGIGS